MVVGVCSRGNFDWNERVGVDREGEGPARRQTDTMPGMVTTHYNREVAAKRMLNEDQQEKIFDLDKGFIYFYLGDLWWYLYSN